MYSIRELPEIEDDMCAVCAMYMYVHLTCMPCVLNEIMEMQVKTT